MGITFSIILRLRESSDCKNFFWPHTFILPDCPLRVQLPWKALHISIAPSPYSQPVSFSPPHLHLHLYFCFGGGGLPFGNRLAGGAFCRLDDSSRHAILQVALVFFRIFETAPVFFFQSFFVFVKLIYN